MKRGIASILLLVALVAGTSLFSFAQLDRASLSGTVTDSSGAVVPGAKITVVQSSTGVALTAQSNESGVYNLVALPIGDYEVTVEKEGFTRIIRPGLKLTANASVRLDFTLQPGAVTQTIEVKAAPPSPLFEERSSGYGTTVETKTLEELPLQLSGSKRDPSSYLAVVPGVYGAGFTNNINGGIGAYSEVMWDGAPADYNAVLHGGMLHAPSAETVGEFKVVQSIAPEYGPTGGSFMSFVTKSGTNSLHGDLFEYERNDALDSRSFFAQDVAVEKQHEFGGSLGGPVVIPKLYNGRDKTFFFFNFTEYVFHNTAAGQVLTLPSDAFRKGDLSALLGPQIGTDSLGRAVYSGAIYDPSTTRPDGKGGFIRDPFPGNIIPKSQFSPVSAAMQALFPEPTLPNQLTNNFIGVSGLNVNDETNLWLKIDQNIAKGRLSGSYKLSRGTGFSSLVLPAWFGGAPSYDRAQAWTLSYSTPIHATAANVLTVALQRGNQLAFQTNPTENKGADLIGLKGTFNHCTPQVNIQGAFPPFGPNPGSTTCHQGQFDTTPRLNDVMTISFGKHTVKFGGSHTRWRTNFPTDLNANGVFNFFASETALPGTLASSTGAGYASFLLGAVDSSTLWAANEDTERSWNVYFFGQDEFKMTPKLVLTYGLSYELENIYRGARDDISQLNPLIPNTGAGGRLGALEFIGVGPGRVGRHRFLSMDPLLLGPRLGFAYAVTSNTTIRGSYGITYGPASQALSSAWADHQGFLTQLNAASLNGGVTPAFNWTNGFPLSNFNLVPQIIPTIANGSATSFIGNGTARPPMIQLLNFSVQRQLPGNVLIEAAYIGNLSHRIGTVNAEQVNQLNYGQYATLGNLLNEDVHSPDAIAAGIPIPYPGFQGSVAQALRPFPQYLGINGLTSFIGNSTYHSAQFKAQKTFSNGLSFLVGYTISKNLSDTDSTPGFFASGVQDAYNRRAEKSVSSIDFPQALVASYVYELPVGTGKKFLHGSNFAAKYLIGGWAISGIQAYTAGGPLGFVTNGRLPTTGDGLALSQPGLRPDVISGINPRMNLSCRGFDPAKDVYLNRKAFIDPPSFAFGNAPRLSSNARGCTSSNENFSLLKRAAITERSNLEFGLDLFNAFNRRNLGGPDTNIDDLSFGQISSAGPGRTMQLHLKLHW